MKKIALLLFFWVTVSYGQEKHTNVTTNNKTNPQPINVLKPVSKKATFFRISPPLTEMIQNAKTKKIKTSAKKNKEINPENVWHPPIINNGTNATDPLVNNQNYNRNSQAVDLNKLIDFEGVSKLDGHSPPDTQGDVSPDYYMQCVNNHTVIKDRSGNDVVLPFPTSDFWQGTPYANKNDGDAIILWDENAERWLVTQLYKPENGNNGYLLLAVSKTADPTGQYYQYAFDYGSQLQDYPKWGIWPDAYYMGANTFNNGYKGISASAFERDKILQGDPNAQVVTFGPLPNTWGVFPADADAFPPRGTPCPFISDDKSHTNANHEVYMYEFHVDWNNTSNSTFSQLPTLNVANYDLLYSDNRVPQPGTNKKLALLEYYIMYRPYFRHFPDHESLVMTRTVNTGSKVGIRWYEFRNSGNGWQVYQQGTYSPNDAVWRWMPSIAMNKHGDISIAYSVSDATSTHPSMRAVARYSTDPLGQMTTNEIELYTGNDSQTDSYRWGDYSMVSVDPDGSSFWFTSEYLAGPFWHTRIIHYELPDVCNYPTTQASNLQAQTQSQNQIDLSWTRGNGSEVIVLAKQDTPVDINPVDRITYNANSVFGNGDDIGNGIFVVYTGTGNSVSITGLTEATNYHFAVYEYDAAGPCYSTSPITGSAITFGAPIVQTLDMLQINNTDAQGQGEVVLENGSPVTERGLCWSTVPNPTINDAHTTDGNGAGVYTTNLTGLTDKTIYYVRAYATNGFGTAYGDNITFRTGCNLITDFPYLQNFDLWTDSTPGHHCTPDNSVNFDDCWENLTGDDSDWDIYHGATGSGNTGPQDDANGGGKYIYLEASVCYNKTASVLSPYFDFTKLTNPVLTFYYHMYGNAMGTLKVFYTIDDGQTWHILKEISGNQGNQWFKTENIDISNLSGSLVQFKITGTTGNGFTSDMAIDNFAIKNNEEETLSYCNSKGNMDYGAILNVVFNQISNQTNGKTHPYEDFTNLNTIVQRNQTYNLTVNVDRGTSFTSRTKAWIDWNQDGEFDDVNEAYDLGSTNFGGSTTTSNSPLSITIPANAKIGTTRMRISARAADTYATPCLSGFYGEVEDYSITVTGDCPGIAYWDGAKWKDFNNQSLTPSALSDKLLVINDVYTTGGKNLEACSMQIKANNAVTINSGDYIKITNDIDNNGSLIVQDKGILVQTDNNAKITGNGTYKISVKAHNFNDEHDYAYWTSPITAYNLSDVVYDAWRYYSFDAATQAWHFETGNNPMSIGKGYAISGQNGFAGGTITVNFNKTGEKFNTGIIQTPVVINGTGAQDDDDWNLIGNPFTSPIDFDTFVTDNPNIEGTYYLWTNCAGLINGQHQVSGYTTYSVNGGSTAACSGNGPTATRYVPAAEGFYVEANLGGNVSFKNSQRTTTPSDFVNRLNHDRVWLHLTNENSDFQQILIGFFDNASDGKDRLYDAHNIDTSTFGFYSLINQERYAIQGLSSWQNNDRIIPIGFTTQVTGDHHISIDRIEGVLSNGVNIYLRDLYNNSVIDLKQQDYVFQADQGSYDDRFELIFTRNSLEINDLSLSNSVNLLSDKGLFTIISKNKKIKYVSIYSIDGKQVLKTPAKHLVSKLDIDLRNLPHQILIFRIKLKDESVTVIKGIR